MLYLRLLGIKMSLLSNLLGLKTLIWILSITANVSLAYLELFNYDYSN